MKIKLSNRLQAVAKLVPQGKNVADIGTDHGYLPVYLVVAGIAPKTIVSDRAKGPLSSAQQLIELLDYSNQIDIRLGDGLKVLQPGEAEVVCIAGMGGSAITEIMAASPEVCAATERFVLQPQRNANALRRYLMENGYRIVAEELACDDGFYYVILAVEHGSMQLSEDELEYGPLLLAQKHPLLGDYLSLKVADMQRLIDGLAHSGSEDAQQRRQILCENRDRISQILAKL